MTTSEVELSKVIHVHYGSALKEAERDQSGAHEVFGSSGFVGHHSANLFDYPSIVIGRKGSVGSVTYAPNGGWAIDTAFFVELLTPKTTDLRYLFYALKNAQLAKYTITTSIPGLSRNDIYRTRIFLPDIEEQRRIADILDKADAIRRKRKEAIALTEELLRSAFLEMFGDPVTNPMGWPTASLGDEAEQMKYGTSEKCDANEKIGTPVLRIPNVVGGQVDWNDLKYAALSEKETRDLRLRAGDVLFVRSNGNPAYIARCAVVSDSDERRGALFASYLIRVRLQSGRLSPTYVAAALSAESYRARLTSEARTTAGNYNISTEGLRRLIVPAAPITRQTQFARLVESTRAAIARDGRAFVQAEDLFNSLVARAFSGAMNRAPTETTDA